MTVPGAAPSRARRFAWCLFDWAGSAFNTIVVTFVFATYFVRAVAPTPVAGTGAWAAATTAAGLVIALIAAPLGAIADRGGHRRGMLAVAVAVLVGATALLWFVRPRAADAPLALGLVAVGTVAFETGFVFYNAMLPDLAAPGHIGRLSGLGWGAGYAGGIACLGLCLVLLIDPHPPLFGLDAATAQPVRATALFAAGWIALFAAPLLVLAPPPARRRTWRIAMREGWRGLAASLRTAAATPVLWRFLLARMIYTDGLNTLFAFGGIYAAGSFGMGTRAVLLLGLALNVSAGVGAGLFALAQDRIGDRTAVLIAVGGLACLGTGTLLAHSVAVFWGLALGLGLFVGPAQSASRSLMARLAPAEQRNALFGLYALSGRATGFLGPAVLGALTAMSGSQRVGMGVVVVLLATGWALLAATPIRPGGAGA